MEYVPISPALKVSSLSSAASKSYKALAFFSSCITKRFDKDYLLSNNKKSYEKLVTILYAVSTTTNLGCGIWAAGTRSWPSGTCEKAS